MAKLKSPEHLSRGIARSTVAAIVLSFAAPIAAGEYVELFRRICLDTAPAFEGAEQLAITAGADRGPDVFDSHIRYFNDEVPFSIQFRHLANDTHQCEVVAPAAGHGEETGDFYRLVAEFAEARNKALFSRGGFHQVVIEDTSYIFSFEDGRGAFVLVTLGP